MSSEPSEAPDFIAVGLKVYPADVFYAAVHTAFLARLDRIVPKDATPRQLARVVRELKQPTAYRAVMNEALRALDESDADVPLDEAIRQADGLPIAAFPNQLDKRIVGR